LSLGREGGHSRRRIVRAADLTGREIERALLRAADDEPNIEIFENHMAVDLLTAEGPDGPVCAGAVVLGAEGCAPISIRSAVVLVATGGAGQVYLHTTNPAIATGDGLAMAYRVGARIANMEFVQFHPTALYPAGDRAFLISEAVRGEGAILRRLDGIAFMDRYHPLGSLAPRDVVALAIDGELKLSGDPYVLLDCSPIPGEEIRSHFPNILAETARRGIDMLGEPLPVVPAAHYGCGGILTDTCGRSSIAGLYAVGEVACNGVHGANRLASNSLLEALVFAARAAEQIAPTLRAQRLPECVSAPSPVGLGQEEPNLEAHRERLRRLMWEKVGIVRTNDRLAEAAAGLEELAAEFRELSGRSRLTPELLELRNLIQAASLIVACAHARRESRGLNFNLDHPYRDNELFLRDTIVSL
jgi:L-aspartate oxidase